MLACALPGLDCVYGAEEEAAGHWSVALERKRSLSVEGIALEIPEQSQGSPAQSEAHSRDTTETFETPRASVKPEVLKDDQPKKQRFFRCSCRRPVADIYDLEPTTPRTPRRTPTPKSFDQPRLFKAASLVCTNSRRLVDSFEVHFTTPKAKARGPTGFNIEQYRAQSDTDVQQRPSSVHFDSDTRAKSAVFFADDC